MICIGPIIGIVSTPGHDPSGSEHFLTKVEIVNWIINSGGIPLTIIPTKFCNYFDRNDKNRKVTIEELQNLKQILKLCDGVIKPGGLCILDYHKYIYNYCTCYDVPYLGICIGLQIMACSAEENAKIVRNNSDIVHKTQNLYAHEVLIDDKSKLYSILGKKEMVVNSRHNYHVENVKKLLVSARSTDNQIEALENPNCKYNIGIQWHPESYRYDNEDSQKIFDSFIESSKQYKKCK